MDLPQLVLCDCFTPFVTHGQRGVCHYTNPCSVISLPNTWPAFSQSRIQILELSLVGSIKETVRLVWPLREGFSMTAAGVACCSSRCTGLLGRAESPNVGGEKGRRGNERWKES